MDRFVAANDAVHIRYHRPTQNSILHRNCQLSTIMKPKYNAVRLLFAAALLCPFASFACAGPGIQYWQTLHKESDYKQLQTGEKVAYVCNQCKTVSEITVESPEQAMALCKEGATVTCPSCKMTTKVVMKGKNNDPSATSEVIYVNDKGEECAFMAKVSEKK